MRAIIAPDLIIEYCEEARKQEKSIGLVPTMGALHDGHLSLVKQSLKENNCTIVSIFINPIQFNSEEDLDAYPRSLEEDKAKLKDIGVDCVFHPSEEDFYLRQPTISFSFGHMEQVLEGAFRPDHFSGVGIVVSKLFNLINPHKAYFGLKDLQQFLIIKRLVRDLSFPIEIIGVETSRETSGLAMSSRNQRLTKHGRFQASNIYKGLIQVKEQLLKGESVSDAVQYGEKFYETVEELEVEYLSVVSVPDMSLIEDVYRINELAICFAGYVDGIRLIDNLYLRLN